MEWLKVGKTFKPIKDSKEQTRTNEHKPRYAETEQTRIREKEKATSLFPADDYRRREKKQISKFEAKIDI